MGCTTSILDPYNAVDPQISDTEILGVKLDLMSVCNVLNNVDMSLKLPPYTYHEILISVSYRLLRRYPLSEFPSEASNDVAIHLGSLTLLSTVLFQSGQSLRISYKLLAVRVRSLIENSLTKREIDDTMLLWLVLLSGISILNPNKSWLRPHFKDCLSALKIDSWESARHEIQSLPWIDTIHNKAGQNLWSELA